MRNREELVEKEVELEESAVELLRPQVPVIRRKGEKKWKTIKIKKETDEQLSKLSKLLGMTKYELIDFLSFILSMLLMERVKIRGDVVEQLGLKECEDFHEPDRSYYYLNPACLLYKFILGYYKKRFVVKNLIKNLKKLREISEGES